MSSIFQNNRTSGFTLLEVLIAMAVLVFISFAIFQATTETYKLRDTLSTEGNFYNSIRLSMSIMQRDIALIYSPTLMMPEPKTSPSPNSPPIQQQLQTYASDDLNQSSTFWSAALDNTGVRPSRFVGTDTKMTFISLSNMRIYKDSPESEFSKITYELKRDEKNTDNPGTLVLVKTESSNAFAIDDYKDTHIHTYELLHGIKKLTYSYYQRDGNTWKINRSWDSDKEETKYIYPDIIELKMEVIGRKQSFDGIFKFRLEIPLNGLDPST